MVKGVGVDHIEIIRIKSIIERDNRFIEKIYSSDEIEYCESKFRKELHYAARFAAKEAFFKALGTGWRHGMKWGEITVKNDNLGKPVIQLKGRTLEYFEQNGFQNVTLSISHSKNVAMAFVVVE